MTAGRQLLFCEGYSCSTMKANENIIVTDVNGEEIMSEPFFSISVFLSSLLLDFETPYLITVGDISTTIVLYGE